MMKKTSVTSSRVSDDVEWTTKYLSADRPSARNESVMLATKNSNVKPMSKSYALSAPVMGGPMLRTERDLKIKIDRPHLVIATSMTVYHDKDGRPIAQQPAGIDSLMTYRSLSSAEQHADGASSRLQDRVPISKTRQKLRKLLCESKGDPDYYN